MRRWRSGLAPHDLFAPAETGSVRRLAPNLQRLVAPNPSPLTGPGTNTYVVGIGPQYLVIDPGPDDATHVDRILAATNGAHQPRALHAFAPGSFARRGGAQGAHAGAGAGAAGPARRLPGRVVPPDATLDDGDVIEVPGAGVRALHTPGHASNHVCLLLEPEGWLLTGDHLMSGSTVVILPPDGSMRLYLESLRRLRTLPLTALLPGHGAVMPDRSPRSIA